MVRNVLLAVLLALAPPTVTFAGPIEEATALIDRWVAAFNARDADALVKLYADDATLLGTVSPTLAVGTDAIRAYFARLPGGTAQVVLGDRRIVALSDATVVGTGFYEFSMIRDGNRVPNPARFTMVVVKREGGWLLLHHHSSQRPKPPQ